MDPLDSVSLTHVVAYRTSDHGIGFQNRLLYHLRADMTHFRQLTQGQGVLMGRKTWESLGGRPLAQRVNLVLSRTLSPGAHHGAWVFATLSEAWQWYHHHHPQQTLFVIGGAELYRLTQPFTYRVYATEIEDTENADHCDTFYLSADALAASFPYRDRLVVHDTTLDRLSNREVQYSIYVYHRPQQKKTFR